MLNGKDIDFFERIGYVNENGRHVYGSASVLHYTYCRVQDLNETDIERGKIFVQKLLNS